MRFIAFDNDSSDMEGRLILRLIGDVIKNFGNRRGSEALADS